MARARVEFTEKVREIAGLARQLDTEGEVQALYEIYREEFDRLARAKTGAFRPGDRVEWTDKRGNVIRGTVTKVNQKTVGCQPDPEFPQLRWRVAPGFITRIDKEMS